MSEEKLQLLFPRLHGCEKEFPFGPVHLNAQRLIFPKIELPFPQLGNDIADGNDGNLTRREI